MKKLISLVLSKYRKYFRKNNAIRRGAEVVNTSFGSFINISRNAFLSSSSIEDYTSVGRNTIIINSEIGKFCSISWNVTIGATKHDYSRLTTHAFPYIKYYGFVNKDNRFRVTTKVGHDVWIGANVIIMPGVSIGNGAVIGAGSIVTKDVQPYEIVFGLPAKHKGYRFTPEIIKKIEELQWWNWDKTKIEENIGLFRNTVESNKEFEKL